MSGFEIRRKYIIFAKSMEKVLYILGGCNGAGKTTASYTVLPELFKCNEFVNADEIAKGLSPFNPSSVESTAGRLMLKRVKELLGKGVTFSIETTLSTRSYKGLVEKAHTLGYKVSLVYFWLESVDVAKKRVEERVKAGGHNIPSDVIERRYERGLRNLFEIFLPMVDRWHIYDNTNLDIESVAYGCKGQEPIIIDNLKFSTIKEYGTR